MTLEVTTVARCADSHDIQLTFVEPITAEQLQELHNLLSGKVPHCSTCQCANYQLNDERLVPGNKLSRGWHKN